MLKSELVAIIPDKRRIWAISSPQGDAVRLRYLHRKISKYFKVGDVVLYLGNVMGFGPDVCGTIDELLLFRRALIAIPGVSQFDVIFLRGQQEEMFNKLMQIQFCPDPKEVYTWMLEHGVEQTLTSYCPNDIDQLRHFPSTATELTKWVAFLRKRQSEKDGHLEYMANLKHTAYTSDEKLLFVHRGINPELALENQGDIFWWGCSAPFVRPEPYRQFDRVVRSASHSEKTGVFHNEYYSTIVSGGGFDAPIYAVLFDENHQPILSLDS